jgi:hypothetical protein
VGQLPVTGPSEPRGEAPRRRRRDDEPVLPRGADEDRDEAWGDRPRSAERDAEWYRRQRPPHHG